MDTNDESNIGPEDASGAPVMPPKRGKRSPMGVIMSFVSTLLMIAIILFLLLQLTSIMSSNGRSVFGIKAFVVLTGSMSPAFNAGSYIIVKDTAPENVKEGDVATIKVGDSILTHRVVRVDAQNGDYMFTTRGDANNSDDTPHSGKDLLGVVIFSINGLGYVVNFLHQPPVLITLFAILIVLIVAPEVFKALRKK